MGGGGALQEVNLGRPPHSLGDTGTPSLLGQLRPRQWGAGEEHRNGAPWEWGSVGSLPSLSLWSNLDPEAEQLGGERVGGAQAAGP